MHPQLELNRLDHRKIALRRRIHAGRVRFAEQIERVTRPLGWIDQARTKWSHVSPLAKAAAFPLGLLLKRAFFPKLRLAGILLGWAPLAVGFFRSGR